MLKNIEKLLKRPFMWSIISVTEENGISHKMAIKKKLFNKKFVIIDSNGVKRETLIAFDGDKINFVDENIELCVVNVTSSLSEPKDYILKENQLLSNNVDIVLKEAHECSDMLLKQQKIEFEQELAKVKNERFNEESRLVFSAKGLTEDLFVVNGCENGERHTFEEPNKYQVEMGYTCVPRTEYYSEKYQRKCGMEFLIELFEHYAQEKNYDGLIDNRFRGCLQKINSIVVELKNNYDIKKLQDLYVMNSLLAAELSSRFINLCEYIKNNDIDFDCYYSRSFNGKSWDDKWERRESVGELFECLKNSISEYYGRVYGDDLKCEFLNQIDNLVSKDDINIVKVK